MRQSPRRDAAAALDELLALDLQRDVVVHVVDAALQELDDAEEARHHTCVEINILRRVRADQWWSRRRRLAGRLA